MVCLVVLGIFRYSLTVLVALFDDLLDGIDDLDGIGDLDGVDDFDGIDGLDGIDDLDGLDGIGNGGGLDGIGGKRGGQSGVLSRRRARGGIAMVVF